MQILNKENKMCTWRRGGSEEDKKSSEGKPKNI